VIKKDTILKLIDITAIITITTITNHIIKIKRVTIHVNIETMMINTIVVMKIKTVQADITMKNVGLVRLLHLQILIPVIAINVVTMMTIKSILLQLIHLIVNMMNIEENVMIKRSADHSIQLTWILKK
jgi:hypothetical protein